LDAPLAILHIKKGNSIFENPSDSTLFEELFAFGKELGGEAHFLCSNDIVSTLLNFIQEEGVTDLVVGAAPPPLECGETPLLPPSIEHVTIHIVDRLKI
jgi:K+-sensing histidine kinase KdpD